MASEQKVIDTIEILEGVFTRWQPKDGTVKAWVFALRDISDEQLSHGLAKFLDTATSDYARQPVPGDIKRYAQAPESLTWEQAFQECLEKAHLVLSPVFFDGAYQPVRWSHEQIPQVMDALGGAEYFMVLRPQDHNTARAQFRDAWRNVQERSGGRLLKAPAATEFKQLGFDNEAQAEKRQQHFLTPEQQDRAKELRERLERSHADTPQDKIIPMISRKLAGKRSIEASGQKGWQEDLKRGKQA